MAEKIKLGYWGIRGAGQVSRLLLAYTKADWENIAYADPNEWFGKDKNNLGLDFPNLPYLIHGDIKTSESSAIARYIIEISDKKELLGKDLKDQTRVNELVGVWTDIRTPVGGLFFDKDWESKLPAVWEKVKPKLDAFEKYVGNKDWALGYLTLVDFIVAELSNHFEKIYPEEYKNYPSLQRIRDNFNNLAEIKEYYDSPNAIKGPFLPPAYSVIKF